MLWGSGWQFFCHLVARTCFLPSPSQTCLKHKNNEKKKNKEKKKSKTKKKTQTLWIASAYYLLFLLNSSKPPQAPTSHNVLQCHLPSPGPQWLQYSFTGQLSVPKPRATDSGRLHTTFISSARINGVKKGQHPSAVLSASHCTALGSFSPVAGPQGKGTDIPSLQWPPKCTTSAVPQLSASPMNLTYLTLLLLVHGYHCFQLPGWHQCHRFMLWI